MSQWVKKLYTIQINLKIVIFTPGSGNAPFSRVILLPSKTTSSELKWSQQILSFFDGISSNPKLFIQRNRMPLWVGNENLALGALQTKHLTISNLKICIWIKNLWKNYHCTVSYVLMLEFRFCLYSLKHLIITTWCGTKK